MTLDLLKLITFPPINCIKCAVSWGAYLRNIIIIHSLQILKENDIPTVLPGRRFIKPTDGWKWTRCPTMVYGRTIGRVRVDKRAIWMAFLCETCKELVYQPGIFLKNTFLVPLKPITDNRRIPDVTVKLQDINRDELQITLVSPVIDWHIWLRRHLCLIAEQPGGYQSPRKHTVMGLVMNCRRLSKDLLREYDWLLSLCLPVLEKSKTPNGI